MELKSKIRHLKSSHVASVRSDYLIRRLLDLLSWLQKKVLHAGSLCFLGKNMVLLYTRLVFHDAIALRYGWDPFIVPIVHAKFTIEHSFSCAKGGFPSIKHNEIRDLTANLLAEVGHEVQVEPHLQPITGEHFPLASSNVNDGARLDISVNGFWGGNCERIFLDVKVFNPYAPSNCSTTPEEFTDVMRMRRNVTMRQEYVKSSMLHSLP